MRWRAVWADSQITGVVVSTVTWLMLLAGWPVTALVA